MGPDPAAVGGDAAPRSPLIELVPESRAPSGALPTDLDRLAVLEDLMHTQLRYRDGVPRRSVKMGFLPMTRFTCLVRPPGA